MALLVPALRSDMLVTSGDGSTRLVVEVRRGLEQEPDDAAHTMRERVGRYAPDSFFLFVATRHFWLWMPSAAASAYQGDTAALLGRYINLDKIPLITLDGREFSLLVYSWLGSVIFKSAQALLELPGQAWLVETGLQPVIYRGYVQLEADLEP